MQKLAARCSMLVFAAVVGLAPSALGESGVVAHEWGTFTTVAAPDGSAMTWIPLGGPVDLPCFVNVFGAGDPLSALKGKVAGIVIRGGNGALTYDQARTRMRATVRMETPVIYFYSPSYASVNVTVKFPQGLVTEWYPSAVLTQPLPTDTLGPNLNSTIEWKNVQILPGAPDNFLKGSHPSHYYPARGTDATPIRVGTENEKFLFYRGVGGFQVPLLATENSSQNIVVKNIGRDAVPVAILFENRDGKVGFRVQKSLSGTVEIRRPELTASVASLGIELEKTLVASGLFQREANAMVETWRDSWFEEGSRLIYIVPTAVVDEILPLSINPAPAQVVRTFVGRIELVTQETISRVAKGINEENEELLVAYGRFLGPITDRLLANASAEERAWTTKYVEELYRSYVARMEATCK